MRINAKRNCYQKWGEERTKMTFCWLVTSLTMYLKSIGLRTDHTQVQKIEAQCFSVTQTSRVKILTHFELIFVLV